MNKRCGIGVFLDAVLLESVELLASLAVEILAVNDKKALVNALVGLKQRRGLEGGQRLTGTGRVPDIAVAQVLVDAIDNRLDRVDLVRTHHQELLFARDEDHVFADHMTQRALGKEPVSKVIKVGNLGVVLGRELVDRNELLIRVKSEVFRIVVGEVQRISTIADDEKLHEAQQRFGVAVSWIILVLDDLFHCSARANPRRFEFDLDYGDTVDQKYHIVAVMAVVRIDAKLMDNLKRVLTPVLDIDQGVVERCAVVTAERFPVSKGAGGLKHVGCDDLLKESLEFADGECYAIQGFKLFPEVRFKRGSVTDVRAIFVLEILQFLD